MKKAIAPGVPSFELHTLGWRAFQDLVAFILGELLGQSVQPFADSNDGGRDGAFYGTWKPCPELGIDNLLSGPIVVQCKHTTNAGGTLSKSMLADEFDKIRKLVADGICESYVLVTNARVTGNSEKDIVVEGKRHGAKNVVVLAGGWINQTIAKNPKLRALVPRIYGLGDLSQIIDERSYAQARNLIDYLKPDLSTFVVTQPYLDAVQAIQENGFVLLLGEPAVGKTVIASVLAMTALDSWGCSTVKVETPEQFVQHWNPNEPNQFFWIDDAFGVVRHDRNLTDEWAKSLVKMMSAISGGAKFVLTSRSYIYAEARKYLKEYYYPLLAESRVVVDVATLTLSEKRQILYNHVKMGDQSRPFRAAVKDCLNEVSKVKPFRPEAARRLGRRSFTAGLICTEKNVLAFMERAPQLLADIYEGLEDQHIAALAIIYMNDGIVEPFAPSELDLGVISKLGTSEILVQSAIRSLLDAFLRYRSDGVLDFHHPTLREGFAQFIGNNSALVDVFVRGLSDSTLLTQVDCGSGALRGALVVVSPTLFTIVAKKMFDCKARAMKNWGTSKQWHNFFVDRSSKDFIISYMGVDPNFVHELLLLNSYLSAMPSPRVLARLLQEGLLGEGERQKVLEMVSELAIDTPDEGWLVLPEFRILLTEQERGDILKSVKDILVPNLDEVLHTWNYNSEIDDKTSAEDYYGPLVDTLETYADALAGDYDTLTSLTYYIKKIEQMIAEIDASREQREPVESYATSHKNSFDSTRSIFDDLDK
ncbi:hypothetical protein [Actinokineospora sp. NBRC 105648]|uniref:nSTAND3 domain-containing NTPase n=1 Tax=Actinokineospora sp. NBRC 105648 TaxID=3032206 RepID=UPI0024A27ADC|nr:hypothetical protein [Actinokineospora sp. NBRC 105648]GLZ38519.1 hypothetical protein Acsp05_21430 [Actinokineospora sp. NBRC 105648]